MPSGHPIKLNVPKLIKLYHSGLTLQQVAVKLKTNPTTIRWRLIDSGIPRRTKQENQTGKKRPGIQKRVIKPEQKCLCCKKVFRPTAKHPHRKYCTHHCSLVAQALIRQPSSLEIEVCGWLREVHIKFKQQAPISKFSADILIRNIVIECDGAYWHSKPEIIQHDIMRNAIMRRMGYHVIRLKEEDIRKRPEVTKRKLLRYLQTH